MSVFFFFRQKYTQHVVFSIQPKSISWNHFAIWNHFAVLYYNQTQRERELVFLCGPEVNQLKLRQLGDIILGNYIQYPFQHKLREREHERNEGTAWGWREE